MAGVVFSSLASAAEAAEDLCHELDVDIFVLERRYPSGAEYTLTQTSNDNCVYAARVTPSHIFSSSKEGKKKAFEAAKRFDLFVKQNRVTVNGYTFTKSYTLVKDIPEDV